MAARNDHKPWLDLELADLRRLSEVEGRSAEQVATYLNEKYHKGQPVRSDSATAIMRTKHKWKVARLPKELKELGPRKEQEVEREETLDGIVLKSRGSRIKTVAELLAHANVTGEVTKQTVKTWDTTLVEGGESKTVQNFAIHVEVKPNQTSTADAVQAIIDGAFAKRTLLPKAKLAKVPQSGLMQALVIADPHVAKHAWNAETGHGDYDTKIATATLRQASSYLMERGSQERLEERHVYILGDFYHYDTPGGTTTKGTPLERDGRVSKMIEEGAKALFDIIETSASEVPTKVSLVIGNHDEVLVHALRLILTSYFRHDKRVTIDDTHTVRKYVQWGKCLIGLTHGDKAKKLLPGLMAREAADIWSQSTLREWHRGHLHYRKDMDTLEGVLIRQHPALCPPDAWHAGEGFVSPRGMDAIIYHKAGAVVATHSYTPDVAL